MASLSFRLFLVGSRKIEGLHNTCLSFNSRCYTSDPDVRWEYCSELRCGADGKQNIFTKYKQSVLHFTAESPGPGCVNSTQCFDVESDPKGETYDGCVNTTVSGKTCQVNRFVNKKNCK